MLQSPSQTKNTMSAGWDCQSSLYDSFELKSFNTQLASAIAASDRSISMPHTSKSGPNHKKPNPPTSRISKSIHRLIGLVFGVNPTTAKDHSIDRDDVDEYFLVNEYLCEGCLLDTIVEEEGEEEVVVVVKKRADVEVKPTALERWFAGRRVRMCR